MTPENLEKRSELERTWEAEEEQRAAIMKKMRWDHARMGKHELQCRESEGGDCFGWPFVAAWMITLTTYYFLLSATKWGKGYYIFLFIYPVLPLAAMWLANIYIFLRGFINNRVLKRPVFIPTRLYSEPADIERARESVGLR
jgi:hypothetical protein